MLRHKGVGAYTARLLHGLHRHCPELTFRVLLPEDLKSTADEFPGVVFEFVSGRPPLRGAIVADIYWAHRIVSVALQKYPDAIFHSPAEIWSIRRPRRSIVTLHDCIYRFFPSLLGGRLRKWWWFATEKYASKCDLVLTVSECSRNDLQHHANIPAKKLRKIYSWVGQSDRRGGAEPGDWETLVHRYQLPPTYILYLGGYNCNKNVERLIQAYGRARLANDLPPLVLAGGIPPGHLHPAVCDVRTTIEQTGLSSGAILTIGPIENADLNNIIRNARFLVFPSLYEGFGYPVAEAMSLGTPVIAANRTSLKEIVRNTHCQFDPTDVTAIAQKLNEAHRNPIAFRSALPPECSETQGIAAYLACISEVENTPSSTC